MSEIEYEEVEDLKTKDMGFVMINIDNMEEVIY